MLHERILLKQQITENSRTCEEKILDNSRTLELLAENLRTFEGKIVENSRSLEEKWQKTIELMKTN